MPAYGDWSVGGLKWPPELKTDAKFWFSTDAFSVSEEIRLISAVLRVGIPVGSVRFDLMDL